MRIVLDAVNTIIFHKPSIPELYSLILKKYGYIVTPDKITKLRKNITGKRSTYESVCRCNDSEVTYQKKWNHSTALLLKECGVYEDAIDKIAKEIHFKINDENASVVIDPSLFSIINTLRKQGHSIGILSNGYFSIKKWLILLNADKYFDFILLSSDIGHLKPCPFAFSRALKEKNQNDHLSVFVGDDLYEDGVGAICGGFNAAIIIDSNPISYGHEQIIYIPKLTLLPQALREVEKICKSQ